MAVTSILIITLRGCIAVEMACVQARPQPGLLKMTYDGGQLASADGCHAVSGKTVAFGLGSVPKPPSGRTLRRSVARFVPVFLIVSVYVPLPPLSFGSWTAVGSVPPSTVMTAPSGFVIETSSVCLIVAA